MPSKEAKPKKRVKQHYVDNKRLLQAMIEYREMISNSKAEGSPRPRVPSYIGCLLYTSPSPRDRTRSRMPSSA